MFFRQKDKKSAQIWEKKTVLPCQCIYIRGVNAHIQRKPDIPHTQAEAASANAKLSHCNVLEGINTPALVILRAAANHPNYHQHIQESGVRIIANCYNVALTHTVFIPPKPEISEAICYSFSSHFPLIIAKCTLQFLIMHRGQTILIPQLCRTKMSQNQLQLRLFFFFLFLRLTACTVRCIISPFCGCCGNDHRCVWMCACTS